MLNYSSLYERLRGTGLEPWLEKLRDQIDTYFRSSPHGDLTRWSAIVDALPRIEADTVKLDRSCVYAGSPMEASTKNELEQTLKGLHPWRKGPFCLHGVHIDTEWRSDWKWDRLKDQIQPLSERLVLDVGCGNGYHLWRMLGAGARLAIGVDPTLLYCMQWQAVRHYLGDLGAYVLPLKGEDVPLLQAFDTVFSMGVLYHRRSPFDHLSELKGCLRPGGELVLETLVIDGDEDTVMLPRDRYAQMRNVWFIPSVTALLKWVERCGFRDARVVDITRTSAQEQRSTAWMQFNSLTDFLDPQNPERTVEGLPPPTRAIILATAP